MTKTLRSATSGLRWSQPRASRRDYDLRSGDDVLATLSFPSLFGTLAKAECLDGCWTFKRVGFWRPTASVRACGSDTDLAIFTNHTWDGGGTLAFAGASSFNATTNFWRSRFEFRSLSGAPVVSFDYGGVFHRSADVRLSPLAHETAESPLLILFGWYLILMLDLDEQTSAGAVVATM